MVFDKKEVLILNFQDKEDSICLEENYARCAFSTLSSKEIADSIEKKIQQNPQLKYILTISNSGHIPKSFDILDKYLRRTSEERLVVLPMNGMFFKIDKNSKNIIEYLLAIGAPVLQPGLTLVNIVKINGSDPYYNSHKHKLEVVYKISKDRYKNLYLKAARDAIRRGEGVLHTKSSRFSYSDLKIDEFQFHEKEISDALEVFIDQIIKTSQDVYLYPYSKNFLISEDLEILTDPLYFIPEIINKNSFSQLFSRANKYTIFNHQLSQSFITNEINNLNLLEPFSGGNFMGACLFYFGITEETGDVVLKWHIKTPEEIKKVADAVFDNLPKPSQNTLVIEV